MKYFHVALILLIVEKLNITCLGTLGSFQHIEKEGIRLSHETEKLKQYVISVKCYLYVVLVCKNEKSRTFLFWLDNLKRTY
jgi:hypothetical protein